MFSTSLTIIHSLHEQLLADLEVTMHAHARAHARAFTSPEDIVLTLSPHDRAETDPACA